MSNNVTHLLLTHGNIQCSPAEAAQLNSQPLVPFFDETIERSPSQTGYSVLLTGYSTYIRQQEMKTNEYRQLLNLLKQLRSTPRPLNGHQLKGSVTTFSTGNDVYRIDYRVHSGQIEVFNIQPQDRLQLARDKAEKIAVYKIQKTSQGVWSVAEKVEDQTVKTKYAAVNGQSNNLSKATWLMGSHLEYEYGSSLNEYTLFHNPSVGGPGDTWESIRDKLGFTTNVTKSFAKVLEKAQQKESDTFWVAHSQGGLIFAEGVRYLLNEKSSWALHKLSLNGARNKNATAILSRQKVSFHGNANNNLRSSRLFSRAGVEVVSVQAHDYDFVTNLIGMNTANPVKLAGSLIYSNHVFSGSVAQSPHTTAQSRESWENNMQNGPGKGRNGLQKIFNATENTVKKVANYLR